VNTLRTGEDNEGPTPRGDTTPALSWLLQCSRTVPTFLLSKLWVEQTSHSYTSEPRPSLSSPPDFNVWRSWAYFILFFQLAEAFSALKSSWSCKCRGTSATRLAAGACGSLISFNVKRSVQHQLSTTGATGNGYLS
jgi:hypothetical protein